MCLTLRAGPTMCGTSNKGVDLAHALYLRILGTKPLKKIFLRPCIANAFKILFPNYFTSNDDPVMSANIVAKVFQT